MVFAIGDNIKTHALVLGYIRTIESRPENLRLTLLCFPGALNPQDRIIPGFPETLRPNQLRIILIKFDIQLPLDGPALVRGVCVMPMPSVPIEDVCGMILPRSVLVNPIPYLLKSAEDQGVVEVVGDVVV